MSKCRNFDFQQLRGHFEEFCYQQTTDVFSKKPNGYWVVVEGLHHAIPRKSGIIFQKLS